PAPPPPSALSRPAPGGPPAPLPIAPPPAGFPVPVPPPKGTPLPPSLDWLTAAHTNGSAVHAEHGAIEQLTNAKTVLQQARDAANAAHRKLDALQLRISDEHDTLKRLERTRAEIVARQQERAVNVYMSGSGGVIFDSLVAAPTVDDGRRSVYAEAAQTVDATSIDQVDKQYRAEKATLDGLEAQAGVARGQVIAAN